MPLLNQVEDSEALKSSPRDREQVKEGVIPWVPGGQPPGSMTLVLSSAVEMSTRTDCSGLPTRKAKEDQFPSSPSLSEIE